MSYKYEDEKSKILTDAGQCELFQVFRRAQALCGSAGVVSMDKLMVTGSSWTAMAYVGHLVKVGVLHELNLAANTAGQDRVFRLAK